MKSNQKQGRIVGKIVVREVSRREFARLCNAHAATIKYWSRGLWRDAPPIDTNNPAYVGSWCAFLKRNSMGYIEPQEIRWEWEEAE